MPRIDRYYRNLYTSPAKRAMRALLLLLLSFLLIAGAAFGIRRLSTSSFYRDAVQETGVPGLDSGLVPQGLAYLPEEDLYLISGYRGEDGAALLSYTSPDGTRQGLISLVKENLESLILHCGGIAAGDDFLYIAGCDGYCYVVARDALLATREAVLPVTGRFPAGNMADFCFFSDGHLYIGEFYHPVKFTTEKEHHIVTPAGDRHYALMLAYPKDREGAYGLAARADAAFSIPGRIQGGCRVGDTIILSASSLFERTHLSFFNLQKAEKNLSEYHDGDTVLPLFHLDSHSLESTRTLPPMSEGICIRNGNVSIVFESAARRFFSFGRLFGGEYLYSLPLP